MSKYVTKDWNKVAEKQKAATAAAATTCVENLTAAVQNGGNPCKLAASDANLKKAQAAITDAFVKGRQKKALMKVDDQTYIKSLDASAIVAGVNNSTKITEFQTKYGPVSQVITDNINKMPNSTPVERDAKVMANLNQRRAKKYKDM